MQGTTIMPEFMSYDPYRHITSRSGIQCDLLISALQKSITAAWLTTSSATHSASCAMPALPGAHHSLVNSGDAAFFLASAGSRPPEPIKRRFMERVEPQFLE